MCLFKVQYCTIITIQPGEHPKHILITEADINVRKSDLEQRMSRWKLSRTMARIQNNHKTSYTSTTGLSMCFYKQTGTGHASFQTSKIFFKVANTTA